MKNRGVALLVFAGALAGCLGPTGEEVASEGVDRIVWVSPTRPLANLALAGLYGVSDPQSLQGLRSLALMPCGFNAAWRDGTWSAGSYEARASWDPLAQAWTGRQGELHLFLDQEYVYDYRLGEDDALQLAPKNAAAQAANPSTWSMRRVSGPGWDALACARSGEDLSCLGATPPAERPAECPLLEGWDQSTPAPFTVESTSSYAGDGAYAWEVHLAADPATMSSIECVGYLLHPTYPNPQRIVCGAASSRFTTRDRAWSEFDLFVEAVTRDGRRWSGPHHLTLQP